MAYELTEVGGTGRVFGDIEGVGILVGDGFATSFGPNISSLAINTTSLHPNGLALRTTAALLASSHRA